MLQSGFLIWVVAGALWGWQAPEMAATGKPWITEALMLVMLGMGLTLRSEDLLALRSAGKPLLIGVGLQYLVMPLSAWLLAYALQLPPLLALGVILVGAAPGGTASNVVTFLAKGDVALSVAMTTASTLLAPIMTPLWIWLLAATWLQVDPLALLLSVARIVLLPVALGILIRSFWRPPDWLLNSLLPLIAMAAIAWIVGVVVGLNADRMAAVASAVVISVLLLNAIGLVAGFGLSRLSGQNKRRCRTVAIEVGMQNSGLAAALAMVHFSPEAALAAALFSVWHNVSGALLAVAWRRGE